jgi:hypothetical protein
MATMAVRAVRCAVSDDGWGWPQRASMMVPWTSGVGWPARSASP